MVGGHRSAAVYYAARRWMRKIRGADSGDARPAPLLGVAVPAAFSLQNTLINDSSEQIYLHY